MCRTPRFCFLIAVLVAARLTARAECPRVHTLAPADTLRSLADYYFGDASFWPAILLATNSRPQEFTFIADPYKLLGIPAVCVPDVSEAQRLRARYETYLRSVSMMSHPEPNDETTKLETVPANVPAHFISWSRGGATGKQTMNRDLWVTLEPHLRDFCHAYLERHNGDEQELTLRLEQRLGLPPAAGYTKFLRIVLNDPSRKTLLRPCSDPSVSVAHCEAAPPSESADHEYAAWFYKQYYFRYAVATPHLYPWTSLGYTFDWSINVDSRSGDFVRFGESEFVIPAGTQIDVTAVLGTRDYCK